MYQLAIDDRFDSTNNFISLCCVDKSCLYRDPLDLTFLFAAPVRSLVDAVDNCCNLVEG